MNLQYSINNGLQIQGIDTNTSIILDNDQIQDSNEAFFLWLKAHKGELKVVGNVATKDGHHQGQSLDYTYSKWMEVYKAFTDTGLKGVPVPVRGNSGPFRGSPENSVGADLIISEAKKCSPQRQLFILVGGQCSTVASAVAKDKSIIPNILVVHVDGKGNTQYNDINHEASTYLMDNGVAIINWSGDLYGWYPGAGYTGWANAGGKPINRMPGFTFPTNINNPFYNIYRSNIARVYDAYGSTGDSPPAAYLVDHSVWQNVVRKTKNNQTVTGAYDYLLVSQNKWADYGPILSGFMNNPENYKQGTTPPVNVAPSVQITNTQTTLNVGNVTLTSVASDPDGTISKVEFFNGTTKLGEDTAAPYSFNWNAIKGTHVITARATDNQGAVTTSMAVTFTITDVVTEPPPTGTVSVGTTTTLQPGQPATVVSTPTQTGIALNFGIPQGIQGPPGPTSGGGSGSGNLQQYKIYSVTDYGATGNGTTDDLPAIKRATDDAIRNKGKLIFPPAQNFYRINSTWEVNLSTDNQLWLDIEMIGTRRGFGIVYMGPSNGKAVRFMGNKAGIISGLKVKIGNNITNTIGIHITTGQYGVTSTSCFTFNNCEVEVNDGINNDAWVLGEDFPVQGDDISQILFNGCTAWGTFPAGDNLSNLPKGQTGWEIRGINTLQLTWVGGGVVYLETGINVVRSGSAYFYGLGGSRIGTFFKSAWSNNFTINGGRFEYFRKLIEVNSGGHPIVTVQGSPMTEDFVPLDGKLIEFNSAGTLILDGCKFGSDASKPMYDARAITLGGNGGAFFMRGGAVKNTTQDLLTATPGWKISVQNVARLNSNHENAGYFNNR